MELGLTTTREGRTRWGNGLPAWANVRVDAGAEGGPASRPNLLLVSIDTLRADRMSVYGHSRPTTPHLERWAQRGGVLRFERAMAPSPWTLPSHLSMFTGADPLRHGVNHPGPIGDRFETVAERLRAAGYATVGLTAGGYVGPQFGFARGFDVYVTRKAGRDDELELGVRQLQQWLGRLPEPWFVFFHTYEVHAPYSAREPYYSAFGGQPSHLGDGVLVTRRIRPRDGGVHRGELVSSQSGEPRDGRPVGEETRAELGRLYDSAIAHTDELLAAIFKRLETDGLERRTAVVVTSDHGESLGEHGGYGHTGLTDEVLRVPLLIRPPGPSEDRRRPRPGVEALVRTVDVAPTLLEMAGEESLAAADGSSLVPLLERPGSASAGVAWAYDALHNAGVAVRRADGTGLVYRDAAWAAVHGRTRLTTAEGDVGDSPAALGSEPPRDLLDEVLARLGDRPVEMTVTASNPGSSPVSVVLLSGALGLNRVRATRLPEACRGGDAEGCIVPVEGGARLTLPPETTLEWQVDGLTGAPVSLELVHDPPLVVAVEPGGQASVTLGAAGWRLDPEPAPESVSLRFRRAATRLAPGEEKVTGETERELRALGYLD